MVALVPGIRSPEFAVDLRSVQGLVHARQPAGAQRKLRLNVKLHHAVAILLALLPVGCSYRHFSASPESDSPNRTDQAKSPTTRPILYHRTGGIAGTDDRVVIWPD